jgi:propanol-preferring alcohol dehydrogenase
MPDHMQAWVVDRPGPIDQEPLLLVEREIPEPGPQQVRVRVRTCGVCRTDLHLAEGDVPPRRPQVTPGHEVVGVIDSLGPGCVRWELGARVGVPWLGHTCGTCRFCTSGRENLCLDPRFTGWDLDGGYADQAIVHEDFAYALPDRFDDVEAAPLLCAGIIGYRALGRVHVMTRSLHGRNLARTLGADSVNEADAAPPEPLDAAILFAPVGILVLPALAALDRGGTLAIAGIHLSDIPSLDYQRHLFEERTLQSVTANTRRDGEEFLAEAARIGLVVSAVPYPMAEAVTALRDLRHGRVNGAAVVCN